MQAGAASKAARRLLACWGNTDAGRLGHGAPVPACLFPRVVAALVSQDETQDVAQVACGGAHTAVVTGQRVPQIADLRSRLCWIWSASRGADPERGWRQVTGRCTPSA